MYYQGTNTHSLHAPKCVLHEDGPRLTNKYTSTRLDFYVPVCNIALNNEDKEQL